jgi:hypothetical protein
MTLEAREQERERRIGLNESVFRKLNEQLKQLADQFELGDDSLLLVCECGYAECQKRLRVPPARYEGVRADSVRFIVAPGHELEDVEEVVETSGEFNIVAKRPGIPASVAEQTDPRS